MNDRKQSQLSPVAMRRHRLLHQEAIDGDVAAPPPPSSSPPHDIEDDQIQITNTTFEKLNQLYELRNYVRDSIDADRTSDIDEVVYRMREFKDFSRRSKRGSSKVLCSLISVSSPLFYFLF